MEICKKIMFNGLSKYNKDLMNKNLRLCQLLQTLIAYNACFINYY